MLTAARSATVAPHNVTKKCPEYSYVPSIVGRQLIEEQAFSTHVTGTSAAVLRGAA